ncbi:hypothetical protein SAMN05192583_0398 [Sphingomonas gellani]|uniref:Outer membrane protein beta-barrel domain-containing protein n=1 Tax=Sphingomonas gellani TaxID=1166340 RepID=A0A1H7YVL3_9SPHN|nr:hypothetical protein [Sphingomonas gellani]SEM49377.1 hypothetical protein SAMN05192583_0398 [Sphingomonas gellani]
MVKGRLWSGLALTIYASATVSAQGPAFRPPLRLTEPVGTRLGRDVRLRIATAPPARLPLQPMSGAPVRKVGGALIDIYPFDDHFHLSAGGRMLNRSVPRGADPESLRTLPTGRAGRRFSPAMLMGYSRGGATGIAVGVDAGVVVGRSDPAPDQRLRGSDAAETANGINGLARMTMRYRF